MFYIVLVLPLWRTNVIIKNPTTLCVCSHTTLRNISVRNRRLTTTTYTRCELSNWLWLMHCRLRDTRLMAVDGRDC